MLEEPTSRPTMDFDPNPNMCPPFRDRRLEARARFLNLSSRLHCRFWFPLRLRFHLARLLFHPLIQPGLLEAPAIPQLERRNLLLADVLVQRVRTHAQILRRLADIHHFSRVGHSSLCLFLSTAPPQPHCCGLCSDTPSPSLSAPRALRVPSIYQPGKTPAQSECPRFSAFFACFLEMRKDGK